MGKKIHVTRGAIVTDVASTRKYMQELKQSRRDRVSISSTKWL